MFKLPKEIMKSSFQHRAFYCYIIMSLWIFFLMTVMYKYISIDNKVDPPKKPVQRLSKSDAKFRKLFIRVCNPPDSIVRGTEGKVSADFELRGVLTITRHGDRGPLTHLRGGDRLPCDIVPNSPLLRSYEELVSNVSGGSGRAPWAAGPGPFHNFPSLPGSASTHCALGQLTPLGLLQMLKLGEIFREAYGEALDLDNAKLNDAVVSYSTRYRRTYQSLLGTLFALSRDTMVGRATRTRESHSVAYCFKDCACAALNALDKRTNAIAKHRLNNHPNIKDQVIKMSRALFESQEETDPEVIKDAILAYMCHEAPLPCRRMKTKHKRLKRSAHKNVSRNLLEIDNEVQNMLFDYINEKDSDGQKEKEIEIDDTKKVALDFDAQMEREKLLYYQQKYQDNVQNYDDEQDVKRNPEDDSNVQNNRKMFLEFQEKLKEFIDEEEDFCIRNEHVMSIMAYLEWGFKQNIKNIHYKKRGLLKAYGLIHNIVKNMIKIISEDKPKFVLYSGHDMTLEPLIIALGLKDHNHYTLKYASRVIFEVYRKKELNEEFKFAKRKPVAQDYFFRVVYNGDDLTNNLSFCKPHQNQVMTVSDSKQSKITTYLCPIENIVRFIHDDYFAIFNVSNFKDACASYGRNKKNYKK